MPRIVDADVTAIIKHNSDIALTAFIAAASVIVDRVVTCASDRGKALTEAEAEAMEAWIAAHLYAVRDQQYQSKTTGDASATFQGRTALSLDGTQWGQMAKLLDPSGCLADQDKEAQSGGKTQVGFMWLGKPRSEQTDYVNRD
jgi:hypothetical protein